MIGVNGMQHRLELSVWDSVLGSWQYYNTPYYNSFIDTTSSSSEIITLKTYFTTIYDRDVVYGCITYDPVLHQFMPRIRINADPDVPGADVEVLDNVVAIRTECCEFNGTWGSYYNISAQAYTYDINLHEWRGGEIESGLAWDEASVSLSLDIAGYLTYSYNDDDWNPKEGIGFYTPSLGIFDGTGFHDIVNGMSGNQDQLYGVFQQFLDNNISSIRIYDPNTGSFPGFVRSDPGLDLMSGGMTYQSYPANLKYLTMFDDFSGEMKIDTITQAISIIRLQARVAAYVDTSAVPATIHYQVFSPTLHDWVRDSTVSLNGVASLNITDGTVHWTDNSATQFKAGYNDTTGWGNFDTPLQLMFQVTNMFPTMGIPLIFVRDYSIGTDNARFYFGDGYSTTYAQGSAWHQYKINGNYNGTPADTFTICIEGGNSSGIQIVCNPISFATPLFGGIATASTNMICPGDSSMLTVTGPNGSIQWQYKSPNLTWLNVSSPGSTYDTLIVNPVVETYYRAKISNGSNAPAFSSIVKVSVITTTTPTPLWGSSEVCNGTQEYYSVDSLPGILYYTWTLPPGWTGSSNNSSILVTPYAAGGTITVSASTVCGTTVPVTKPVTITIIDTSLYWDGNEFFPDFGVTGVIYSWIDCATGTEVGTDNYYEPIASGSYALILTYEGCVDTSSCWDIIITGQENILSETTIAISPNPASDKIFISSTNIPHGNYEFVLYDAFGRIVKNWESLSLKDKLNLEIDISELSSGPYILNVKNEKISSVFRILKL